MSTLPQNLRYTLRVLGRNPGFTTVAILSLALGIGANTAIFTLINALLLRSLPVPHPERLVEISAMRMGGKVHFSYPMYRELMRGQRVLSGLTAWTPVSDFNCELEGVLSRRAMRAVSGNYFSELGAVPAIGRLISLKDENSDDGSTFRVAVLDYEFWQRRFAGAPEVVGKQIRIQGQAFTIIGVTRRWFTGVTPGEVPEITVPLTAYPWIQGQHFELDERSFLWIHLTGRLRDDVTLPQARTQLESLWPAMLLATAPTEVHNERRQRFLSMALVVASEETGFAEELRRQYSRPLFVLLGIVGLILLLACVNLANLLLARAAARSEEFGVRVALGANRWKLMRQALLESLTVSFAGGLAGLAIAYWGCRWLIGLISPDAARPIFLDLRPDLRVLGMTFIVTLLAGVLAGLAPAWRVSREGPGVVIQQNTRGMARSSGLTAKSLIVTQVALSLVLLVGAGLLARTFEKLSSAELGFEQEKLLEMELATRPDSPSIEQQDAYHQQVIERISALPGVHAVAFTRNFLPVPRGWLDGVAPVSSDPTAELGPRVSLATVSPRFFDTLGIRLLRGRDFNWMDDPRHVAVAVLSHSLAWLLFPGKDPIGQRIRFGVMPEMQALEVVGIVEDARLFDPRAALSNVVYVPSLQHHGWGEWSNLFIRTSGPPAAVANSAVREIEALGREYVSTIKTVAQATGDLLVPERVLAILSGLFAGVALLLACVGLYGLMSYSVTRRTREIGIRSALGATQGSILLGVLRETLLLTMTGMVIGVPCAFGASRLIAGMLYGVSPSDPATLAAGLMVLLLAAFAAGYLPARRAAAVDPIVALRAE
jgi:predicted permease